jgi:mannose-6-phosphate isomerase-like protein (cupin superfamily)
MDTPTSIPEAIAALPGPYQPADLVNVNDAIVRVARLDGEFPWHRHDEDELFLCWDGEFRIELEGGISIGMKRGDVYVIAAGVEHRPVADSVAHCLLLEKPETLQYGNDG